jgi:hypothetical protein
MRPLVGASKSLQSTLTASSFGLICLGVKIYLCAAHVGVHRGKACRGHAKRWGIIGGERRCEGGPSGPGGPPTQCIPSIPTDHAALCPDKGPAAGGTNQGGGSRRLAEPRPTLEHFQEKWTPVFRPKMRQRKNARAVSASYPCETALVRWAVRRRAMPPRRGGVRRGAPAIIQFGALEPSLRHSGPHGPVFPAARELGHDLAFGGKSQELLCRIVHELLFSLFCFLP